MGSDMLNLRYSNHSVTRPDVVLSQSKAQSSGDVAPHDFTLGQVQPLRGNPSLWTIWPKPISIPIRLRNILLMKVFLHMADR